MRVVVHGRHHDTSDAIGTPWLTPSARRRVPPASVRRPSGGQLKRAGSPRPGSRIGLESGLLSAWHWHALKALGLPVVCLDARHAKAALSLRLNKTDANDAAGLAQIVRTGWYRQVQVKSLDSHLIRTLLGARAGLVTMHRDIARPVSAAHSRPLAWCWGRWRPERSKPVFAN